MFMRFAAILATLTLSFSLVGCCGWHHRQQAKHSACRCADPCACPCPCPSNAQPQAPAPAAQ